MRRRARFETVESAEHNSGFDAVEGRISGFAKVAAVYRRRFEGTKRRALAAQEFSLRHPRNCQKKTLSRNFRMKIDQKKINQSRCSEVTRMERTRVNLTCMGAIL